MATQWILGKVSDALQPTIQSTVSAAGTFAGGAFNTVGNGINGVGESISTTIKRYGDGFKDYGNGVMDWTNAPGPRAQTASNPLGLGGGNSQGKRAVTNPSVYSAPKLVRSKSAPAPKVAAAPAKKALPAPTLAPATATKPAAQPKKAPTTTTQSAPSKAVPSGVNPGAFRKPANAATKKSATAVTAKPRTATVTKARPPSSQKPNYIAAANPLGLKC